MPAADALPVFGPLTRLSPDALTRLGERATPLVVSPGAILVEAGAQADACWVLLDGLLRVELGGEARRPVSAPALVGEMAIVLDAPRSATVVAESACSLLRISADAFREELAENPEFAVAVREQAQVLAADAFLRRGSPFADLPSDALEQLSRCLVPVTFDAGAVIIAEGATDDDAYLIRNGRVEVVRTVAGVGHRLALQGPGQFVGETAALTGAARTATVRAVDRVDTYRLAATDFRPLLRTHQALVERFGEALRARHRPRATAQASALPCPDDPSAVILRNDASGAYVKVSREALSIFEDLDGERTLRDLVLRHFQRTGAMDPSGVFRTIATLQSAGFASAPQVQGEASVSGLRLRLLDLVLAPRLEARSIDRAVAALYTVLRPFVSRPTAAVALVLGIAGAVALVAQFREFSIQAFGIAGVIVAWGALFLAGLGHETAHALACKAFGSRLGRAGVGLMFFSPLIWVDTTDTWTLDRRKRVLVNAAGPLFNLALGGAAALIAIPTSGGVAELLLWFAGMNYLSVAFNLSPLTEFDGYYVLSDLTSTPMLRRRALRFVFRQLWEHPRLPRGRTEWGLFTFAAAAVAYALGAATLVVLAVPATVRTALSGRVGAEWLLPAGVAVAVVLVALTMGPLVDNVMAARAGADEISPGGARSAA